MDLLNDGKYSSNSKPAEKETMHIHVLANSVIEYKAIRLKHCTTLMWIQVFVHLRGAADCQSDIRNVEHSRKQRITVRQHHVPLRLSNIIHAVDQQLRANRV